MKIKMCGITTPADVAAVNEVRPDYIGMVMYFPKSKRNVSVETARRLLEELRKDVKKLSEKRKTKNRFQTCLNISCIVSLTTNL